MIRILLIVLSLSVLDACSNIQARDSILEEKIKGMNYTGPGGGPFGEEPFTSMESIGSNFVALIPEATLYQNTLQIKQQYWGDSTWYGESTEGVLEGIMQARRTGLKIMIKPHLWPGLDLSGWDRPELDRSDTASWRKYYQVREEFIQTLDLRTTKRVKWRGDILPKDEEAWKVLAESYRKHILAFAVLADSMDVEIYCIGTELKAMALNNPEYWRALIEDVRKIYGGAITYAANWDSYSQISFWDELDFIGIDAYFPLGDYKVPTVEEGMSEWIRYKEEIQRVQIEFKKPIIFTEWGYETEEYSGKTPWGSSGKVNNEVQKNLYEATFRTFWNESWFQGVFIWRWSPDDEFNTGTYNFSPKGKPAAEVLEKWFKD